jgi:hypothetical protein
MALLTLFFKRFAIVSKSTIVGSEKMARAFKSCSLGYQILVGIGATD